MNMYMYQIGLDWPHFQAMLVFPFYVVFLPGKEIRHGLAMSWARKSVAHALLYNTCIHRTDRNY